MELAPEATAVRVIIVMKITMEDVIDQGAGEIPIIVHIEELNTFGSPSKSSRSMISTDPTQNDGDAQIAESPTR